MKAVEHGSLKLPGMTPEKAKEYTSHNTGKYRFKVLQDKKGRK